KLKGNTSSEYSKMEKYLRMSYASFNSTMLDYFYKFMMPKSRNAHEMWLGKTGAAALAGYERLRGKRDGEELSNFDYFWFYSLRTIATSVKERSAYGLLHMLQWSTRL